MTFFFNILFQFQAVIITFLVVEQLCVVYKISIPECLYFITYFNRYFGTWLFDDMKYELEIDSNVACEFNLNQCVFDVQNISH